MKKTVLVGAIALVAAACAPSVPQTTTPDHTYVEFDPAASPPVVPTPTDLAKNPATGKLDIPIDPNSSPANQEFTRDYLNTLDGYPAGVGAATALVHGDLDPSSVKAGTVLVVDLTTQQPVTDATIQYDASAHAVRVLPPSSSGGLWTKGHTYEVAILGGASGVKAADGSQVYGSAAWALVRSAQSLVACDGSGQNCRSTSGLLSDAQATALEQVRKGYAPLFDALSAQGVPRSDVAVLWTFGITDQPEMRFDPTQSIIPFPSDLVRTGQGGTLNLPVPDGGSALETQLYMGLNTLDGFSTTAPIVSENSDTLPALTDGASIDPASVSSSTVGLFPLGSVSTPPDVRPCLIPDMSGCETSTQEADGGYALPDGGAVPQQLQLIPVNPLQGNTEYGYFFTTALKDKAGKNVAPTTTFALMRLANPVYADGHSTVQGVSDAQAQQLEVAREALKGFFDFLAQSGHPRSTIALATPFKTQSEQSVLDQLHGIPAAANVPTAVLGPITDVTTSVTTWMGSTNSSNIKAVYTGEIVDPFLLTGPGGTINPDPTGAFPSPIPFVLTLPVNATGSVPVVIFGHGLQGNHFQMLGIANSLAGAGFATIAIDEVWHGDRTSCTGVGSLLGSDDAACEDPNTEMCDEQLPIGHCVSRTTQGNACSYLSGGGVYCQSIHQGVCLPPDSNGDSFCSNGDLLRTPFNNDPSSPPALWESPLSGWNLFNLGNLFATRDNFRQQVIDDAQLARVIQASGANSLNAKLTGLSQPTLDGTNIHYVGQSLGGILGTLYASSAPEVHKTVLNVPAGDLFQIFMTTPNTTLGALRTGFLATLGASGIQPGTPTFDTFAGIAKWILDPADPVNAGYGLTHGVVPTDRQVLMQYIQNDQTLPNPTTQELISAAAAQSPSSLDFQSGSSGALNWFEFVDGASTYDMPTGDSDCTAAGEDPSDASAPCNEENRHGFLLNGVSPTLTGAGQAQVATFLDAGTVLQPQ